MSTPIPNQGLLKASETAYEVNTAVLTIDPVPVHSLDDCEVTEFPPRTLVTIVEVGDNASTPVKGGRLAEEIPVSHRRYKVKGIMTVEVLVKGGPIRGVPHSYLFPNVRNSGTNKQPPYQEGSVTKMATTFTKTLGHGQLQLKAGEEVKIIAHPTTSKGSQVTPFTSLSIVVYSVVKVERIMRQKTFRSSAWVLHRYLALAESEANIPQ